MANLELLVLEGGKRKRRLSADQQIDFLSLRIGPDELLMQQGGSGAGAYFDFGTRALRSSYQPINDDDVVNKRHLDQQVILGGIIKEQILIDQQLDASGILGAQVFFLSANAIENDSITISDGNNPETYTFKSADGVGEPELGVDAAESMASLAAKINEESVLYSALFLADGLDEINVDGVVVIYEKVAAAGASPARIFGTFDTQSSARVVEYNTEIQYLAEKAHIEMPSVDPDEGRFGFRKEVSALVSGEIHSILSTDQLRSWNADQSAWFTMSAGAIPTASSAPGGATQGKVSADEDLGLEINAGVMSIKLDSESMEFVNSGDVSLKIANDAYLGELLVKTINGVVENSFKVLTNDEGVTIDALKVVGLFGANYELVSKDTGSLDEIALGLTLDQVDDQDEGRVLVKSGVVVKGLSGLTSGADYYLDGAGDIALYGDITYAAGNGVVKIGKAISATELRFMPVFDFEY
jgi:hypothetical protein